eukprot:gene12883-7304_t
MLHELDVILKSEEDIEVKIESLNNFSEYLKEKEDNYKKENGVDTQRVLIQYLIDTEKQIEENEDLEPEEKEKKESFIQHVLEAIHRCAPLVYSDTTSYNLDSIVSEDLISKIFSKYIHQKKFEKSCIGILGYSAYIDDDIKNQIVENKFDEIFLLKLKDEQDEETKFLLVKCLSEISDFQEIWTKFNSNNGMELIKKLLSNSENQQKKLTNEIFQWINGLLVHHKFCENFYEYIFDSILIDKYENDLYYIYSVGNMICQLLTNEIVIEKVMKNKRSLDRMFEFGVKLLNSSEYKKIGCSLFQNSFFFKELLIRFDKFYSIKLFLDLLRLDKNQVKIYIVSLSNCFKIYLKNNLNLVFEDEDDEIEILNRLNKSSISVKSNTEFINNDGIDLILSIFKISLEEWKFQNLNLIFFEILHFISFSSSQISLIDQKNLTKFIVEYMNSIFKKQQEDEEDEEEEMNEDLITENENSIYFSLKILYNLIFNNFDENIEHFRNFNGIRILLNFLKKQKIFSFFNEILNLLELLLKNENLIQIFKKLNTSFILSEFLMKLKNLKEKEKILDLLKTLTGTEIQNDEKDPTLIRVQKNSIVSNTKIEFNENELISLIFNFLKEKKFDQSAEMLKKESKLDIEIKDENVNLDKIIIEYLRNQHKECENPIEILPEFSLTSNHKCPDLKKNKNKNQFNRIFNTEMIGGGLRKYEKIKHRKLIQSKFKYSTEEEHSIIDEELISVSFLNNQKYYIGTERGDLLFSKEKSIHIDESIINGIQFNYSNFSNFLTWNSAHFNEFDTYSYLWSNTSLSSTPVLKFENCKYTKYNHAYNQVIGSTNDKILLYDLKSNGSIFNQIRTDDNLKNHIACFNPYDDMILRSNVIWDFRIPTKIVHQFDKLSEGGVSLFHPNGNEIIINNEIWDLRTLKLTTSCSALKNSKKIIFNDKESVFYVTYKDRLNMFQSIDSTTFKPIEEFDMEKTIVDFDVDIYSNKIGFIFNSSEDDYSREFQIIYMGETNDEEEDEMNEEEEEDEELVDENDTLFDEVDGFYDGTSEFDSGIMQDIEDDFNVEEELIDEFVDEEEEEDDEIEEEEVEEF